MRIGFDASPLVRPHPPGIVRAVGGALAALERTPGITALRLAPRAGENLRFWRQVRLPGLVRERGLEGLHSFVSAFPLFGEGARVQTVHELPWLHGVRENAGLGHRFWARIASRRADRVVTASAFVARELARGPLALRVRVAPWGVDAARFATPPALETARALRGQLGLPAEPAAGEPAIVAAVGAVRRKKDLAALLRGLAERKRRGGAPVLVAVTGAAQGDARRDQALALELGLAAEVRWLGALDDAHLIALLHAARACAVLSRSEGFGLPVLEAFAVGRPVLVARASAAAEVAAVSDAEGGLGIAVDPGDPASVADGLESALAEGSSGGGRAAARRARAAEFSWERCAARIAEIWRELA